MPRTFAKVNAGIWGDPDFRRLPPAAQHLYLTLWTSPDLSFCGVHDWRPARLTGLSNGWTGAHVELIANCLQARHFLVVDAGTEEVLIRSWARFDEVLKQPRLAISYVNAYSTVASQEIRQVLVQEAQKMQKLWPELTCWVDPRVVDMLGHPAISAKGLALPEDPFGDGLGDNFAPGLALGLPQNQGKVWGSVSGSVSVPPTTTDPDHNKADLQTREGGKPPRAASRRRLPEDFKPSDDHLSLASELGVDIRAEWPKFVDHWKGTGEAKADWSATLRNWIRRAAERPGVSRPSAPVRTLPRADELELPPDGLSDEEYAAWEREQRQKRQGGTS